VAIVGLIYVTNVLYEGIYNVEFSLPLLDCVMFLTCWS